MAAYAAPGATGITLDQTSLRLYHNASPRTAVLTASVLPEGAKQTVTWSSSDEGVATVEDGLVRAVAEGTAVITVTSADGGFTAQCSVRVRTRHASSNDSGSSGSGSGSAGGSAATPEVPPSPHSPSCQMSRRTGGHGPHLCRCGGPLGGGEHCLCSKTGADERDLRDRL